MENEINELFIDINPDAMMVPAVFVEEKRALELIRLTIDMVKDGKEMHKEKCSNDEQCRGANPFIMNEIKSYLITHPELTELERLCIINVVGFEQGLARGRVDDNGIPSDAQVVHMNANDLPPGMADSIKEFIDNKNKDQ